MKDLKFTELEQTVLTAFIDSLYAEAGFSDVDAHDLAKETGLPTKQIRGVIASLIKKGVVFCEETDNFGAPEQYVIIYLRDEFYHLHPRWGSEQV